jgi:hypothetical protein
MKQSAAAWEVSGPCSLGQIAETFAGAGLPDGCHRAGGDAFARLRDFKDAPEPPTLEEALRAISADPRDN